MFHIIANYIKFQMLLLNLIYDLVIGAVANDTVMPTIQAYLNGFINEEATIITLKTSNLVDQICLKTEKALSLLKFVNVYETRIGENTSG